MDYQLFLSTFEDEKRKGLLKKCIQKLLTALQNGKRRSIAVENNTEEAMSTDATECIFVLLQVIQTNYDPEVIILSATCIAFILERSLEPLCALTLYLKLSVASGDPIRDINALRCSSQDVYINDDAQSWTFNYCAFLYGLLNCRTLCSSCVQNSPENFVKIHSVAIHLCSQKLLHKFHCFKLLENWYKAVEFFLELLLETSPNFLNSNSGVVQNTLCLVNSNWENPINGITDCVKVTYRLLLSLHCVYCKIKGTDCQTFLVEQAMETSKLPWSSKAKYRRLSVLTGYLPLESLIGAIPTLPEMMFKNLSINSIASAITELYKMILKRLDGHEDGFAYWQAHFSVHVASALCSESVVVYNNTMAHVLPPTVQKYPNSSALLLELIKGNALATVILKRICRKFASKAEAVDHSELSILLSDENEEVRYQALQLLTETGTFPSSSTLDEVLKFLEQNLNVDSPSFRQKLVAFVSRFLSSIVRRTKVKPNSVQGSDVEKFSTKYFILLCDNIVPGTSFQRRTTTLLLLESFFKNDVPVVCSSLHNLLANRLILCMLDRDDGIRKLCHSILLKLPHNCLNFSQLLEVGLHLIHSPRHHEAHGGSLLISVCAHRHRASVFKGVQYNELRELLQMLLTLSREHVAVMSSRQLLKGSSSFPLHGCILSIQCSLSVETIRELDRDYLCTYLRECKTLARFIIQFMLSWISEESNTSNASPSFLDMSQALSKVIRSETGACDLSTIPLEFQYLLTYYWLNIKECCMLLSKLVKLQRDFAETLLTLENVLEIGETLVEVLLRCRHKGAIEACCIALTEYACNALYLYKRLSFSSNPVKHLVVKTLNVIETHAISSNVTRRSAGLCLIVQGLLCGEACFINENSSNVEKGDAVVCQLTIETLMSVAGGPACLESENITTDDPRTIALHALRTIVNANPLSNFVNPFLEALLNQSLAGLFSKQWCIRNASLQLYGVCCQRILGQRKVGDHAECLTDTLTAEELMLKFPSLFPTLEKFLDVGCKKQEDGSLDYSLVPVLSLLSSVSICGSKPTISTNLVLLLTQLLGNKIWKVRCLAARSLLSVVTVDELHQLLLERISRKATLTRNQIHGLLLLTSCMMVARKTEMIFDGEHLFHIYNQLLPIHLQLPVRFFGSEKLPKFSLCYENGCETKNVQPEDEKNNLLWLKDFDASRYRDLDIDERHFLGELAVKTSQNLKAALLQDSDLLCSYYDAMFCLIQDEDHDVRHAASKAVFHYLDLGYVPSFTVALNSLLEDVPARLSAEDVCSYLWAKLESVEDLACYVMDARETVIFEEERNLFAEPVKLLIKFYEKLEIMLKRKPQWRLPEASLRRIAEEAAFVSANDPDLNAFVKLGINKMSAFYCSISSLALRLKILNIIRSNYTQDPHVFHFPPELFEVLPKLSHIVLQQ